MSANTSTSTNSSRALSTRRFVLGVLASWRAQMLVWGQYRANVVIWATTGIVQVVIYLSVWSAVADASGGSTAGFTAAQFAGYFCVLLFVREATFSWVAWEFSGYVQSGKLASFLSRPQHPIAYLFGSMSAYRTTSLLLVVPTAAVLFWAFDAQVDTSAAKVLVALALLPVASMVRYLSDVLIGLSSMWLIRISGVLGAYYTVVLFLSGQFAPIDVLPHWMQLAAKALPFWWILGYPTELLIGRGDLGDAWIAAVVLGGWLAALLLVLRTVWPRAMRAAETVGG